MKMKGQIQSDNVMPPLSQKDFKDEAEIQKYNEEIQAWAKMLKGL
jgi:hypothetical protein